METIVSRGINSLAEAIKSYINVDLQVSISDALLNLVIANAVFMGNVQGLCWLTGLTIDSHESCF